MCGQSMSERIGLTEKSVTESVQNLTYALMRELGFRAYLCECSLRICYVLKLSVLLLLK